MARKTLVDKLNEAISGILSQYADEIDQNVGEIAVAIGKKGVQALKSASRETFPNGTGAYASGWKQQVTTDRTGTVVTIYNEHPGKPHLLENGHVCRNGTGRTFGRVPGHPHIKPVADELVETFEREVTSKL